MSALHKALEDLDRTDPRVGDAAKRYAKAVAEITDRSVVTVTTRTEPDVLGRQRFLVVWWDEGFHLGPQWRGQVSFMRVDDFLDMPGNRPIHEGRKVVRRHCPEGSR